MKRSTLSIRILSLCVVAVGFVFIAKLYFLQILRHDQFVGLADRQYSKSSGGIFNRGNIYFEHKDGSRISAAGVKTGFTIAIIPKAISNPEELFETLSKFISLDKDSFIEKAKKENDPYEEIAKKIDEQTALKISALKIPSVRLVKERWRVYPGGENASHVLGIVAYKGDELAGRYGLEKFYDKTLSRKEKDLYANFFVEIFSNIKSGLNGGEREGDLLSTIEPTVQTSLEETLKKVHTGWSSAETSGIIINPKNGEIYAMASFPNFDPNNFSKEKSALVFSNPLVEEVKEMGSIIKPLTMAAGIDAGVVTPSSTYFDKGSFSVDTETIYNYDKKGRGQISMQEVLNHSLNTGVSYVVTKLGTKKFGEYMMSYGLGEKTGIDLPNEAQNIVGNLKSPRTIEYITASFGQGIALTPVSTVRAMSALANGGVLVKPHVVKKIEYSDGISFDPLEGYVGKQAIKKESADEITRMLVKVVDTSLLNGKGKNPHYSVAAKTGTAQIASPEGGYYSDRVLHSFVGYFPAYNPQFLVLMYTVYPKGVQFAAETLAEPFLSLSKFLINYYNIPPDR